MARSKNNNNSGPGILMNGSKTPRYILFALMLGIAVTGIMLSMFYGQYHWLASEIVERGSIEHNVFLENAFESRSHAQMNTIADDFAARVDANDSRDVLRALNRALSDNTTMTGLRFTDNMLRTLQSGNFPVTQVVDSVTWLENDLIMVAPVVVDGVEIGRLAGSFELDELRAEASAFAAELTTTEVQSRRISYLWIGLGTLAVVVVCGFVVWLIARDQTLRIRALKRQAEKLRDADFGESLSEKRGDELGELASVFNSMRERLQETTFRRDYVDSILSSMNDAIIVTSRDGRIKRINKATTHVLGYDEGELVDTSIDY
ncbi:MAG: HAMP domain-containing protein, partial [Woeseiaceae bacterium]